LYANFGLEDMLVFIPEEDNPELIHKVDAIINLLFCFQALAYGLFMRILAR